MPPSKEAYFKINKQTFISLKLQLLSSADKRSLFMVDL
jgi:hypothetical protein